MKNIKILKLIVLILFMSSKLFSTDNCTPVTISTNPYNPINGKDENPHKRLNNFFDWTVSEFPIFLLNRGDKTDSPLWEQNVEYKEFLKNQLKPEDGWELINVVRGYNDKTILIENNEIPPVLVPIPYVLANMEIGKKSEVGGLWLVLYNKYSSKLRLFVNNNKSTTGYTGGSMSIHFFSKTGDLITNLLMNPDESKPLIPLEEITNHSVRLDYPVKYLDNPVKWLFAEFPMVYDPCTCFFSSQIHVTVDYIEESNITLDGTINGTITDINDKNKGTGLAEPNKSFSMKTLEDVGKKAVEGFKSGADFVSSADKELFKYKKKEVAKITGDVNVLDYSTKLDLQTYIDGKLYGYKYSSELKSLNDETEKQKTGLDKLLQDVAGSSWLKDGLSAVPYISSALSIYDYFTGGGSANNSIQKVSIQPMSISTDLKVKGKIVKVVPYDALIFYTPGSDHTGYGVNDNIPIYDQTLGTFNLLRSPIVKWREVRENSFDNLSFQNYGDSPPTDEWSVNYIVNDKTSFKLKNNLDFVINPASDLKLNNEDLDIIASIEIEMEFLPQSNQNSIVTHNLRSDVNSIILGSNLLVKKNPNTFYSRYLPLQCLNDVTLNLNSYSYFDSHIHSGPNQQPPYTTEDILNLFNSNPPASPKPTIKSIWINIIANLKRKDIDLYPKASNVLFKGKYKVNLEAYTGTTPNIDFASSAWENYPESITLQNTTINSDMFAWEDITIGDNVTVGTGGPYKITAGNKIIVDKNINIPNQNLILQTGVDKICNTPMYDRVIDVSSFCNSQGNHDYKSNNRIQTLIMKNDKIDNSNTAKTGLEIKTELYNCKPNPANSSTSILYYAPKGSEINFDISNIFGEVVIRLENTIESFTGEHSKIIDTSKFPSGTYFVTMRSAEKIETKKLIIIK